ncbi:MAG TPA: DMT family transporter [Gammaproteobacteria bacterium]|nr:DMT family transporter [Gammaproteobacteria bacterium]
MTVPIAYLGVILIWSTTPLGVKWSGEEVGFLFGVTARMVIGTVLTLVLLRYLRMRLVWHRKAIQSYLAASLGIYGAMILVYAGAQYIPSSMIAILFGLSPLTIGIMAALFLGENSLTPMRIFGIVFGISGLVVIFSGRVHLGDEAQLGIFLVTASTLLHSISAVLLKRVQAGLPAMVVNGGGLLIASVLYLLTWLIVDGSWPTEIPPRAGYSILYLGIVATLVGFSLYFYLIHHLEARQVALIPMITPVTAMLLGHLLNNEIISTEMIIGTAMISFGLMCYQWGHMLKRRLV